MNILYDATLFTSENNNAGSGYYRTNTIQNTGQTQILCVICCVLYCNGQQTKKWSDVSKMVLDRKLTGSRMKLVWISRNRSKQSL